MATKTPIKTTVAKMTRARAEYLLTHGADPTSDIYTKHTNKHVQAKAAKLAARNVAAVPVAAE